jgi:hypothetical protein
MASLEEAARNGPGRDAVLRKEPVKDVVTRLGLDQTSREILERLAVLTFGQSEMDEEQSVPGVMSKLGLIGDASRQALERMLPQA